jgi:hypothetical protein
MKTRVWPRALLAVSALSLLITGARADDILANGNFSEGKAHWKGDGKTADSTDMTDVTASLDHSGDASGMYVPLSQKKWTSISQVFNTRETALTFSMTYKTSADFSLHAAPNDLFSSVSVDALVQQLVGFPLENIGTTPTIPETALVIISDPTQNLVIYSYVKLPDKAGDSETASTLITGLMAHEEKTLIVAFPEGYGKITLSNISLSKPSAGAQPPPGPFPN